MIRHNRCWSSVIPLLGTLLIVMGSVSTFALNVSTHRLVNRQAARLPMIMGPNGTEEPSFGIDLRTRLGLAEGLATELWGHNGRRLTVEEWLEEGGDREDDRARFFRHFHDPLRLWGEAGLDRGNGPNESSIQWMQNPNQVGPFTGDGFSWRDARNFYQQALTERDPLKREFRWAATFRALGQIMHLVVDASNPEHTRNTQHLNVSQDPNKSYEYWVSHGPEGHGANDPQRETAFVGRFLSMPIGFHPGILQIPITDPNEPARVPIARLIDTDSYTRNNPDVTLQTSIGIGEVSNANFFTTGTFGTVVPQAEFPRQYPSPSLTTAGLTRQNLPAPRPTPFQAVRTYVNRPEGLGLLPAFPLAAVCASTKLDSQTEEPCFDDAVWRQIATHMLPRAVGYARGVLDYFFRGSATVKRIEWTELSSGQSGFNITLQNTSQEEMSGVFEIYGRLESGTPREQRMKLLAVAGGQSVTLAKNEERVFFTQIAKPPAWKATPSLVLVFKGRLGLEEDAVVGQVFTVPWVEVKQASYDGDIAMFCDRPPERSNPEWTGQPGTTWNRVSKTARCEWRASTHRVDGTIVTNRPIDPATGEPQRVIDSIEARWFGAAGGPAPLTLDGVAIAGGRWQRGGSEPDPVSFSIADPTDRGLARLFLLVNYRGGGTLSVTLATFGIVRSTHGKEVWAYDNPQQELLVTSGRSVGATLAYNFNSRGRMRFPLFGPVSVGGAAVPTDTRTFQTFHDFSSGSGILATEDLYIEAEVDDFETFRDDRAALEYYIAIEPLEAPHPDGPVFNWTATVQRTFQPQELQFLQLFVTDTPTPHQVQLTGQVGGSPTLTSNAAFTTSAFEGFESSSSEDAGAAAGDASLDTAWVETITTTGGVGRATLSTSERTTLTVGVGDQLGSDGGRIVAITEAGVTIERRFLTAGGELVVHHTLPGVR